jgi:hypothetical protein
MEDFRKLLAARLAGQQREGEAHPTADVLTAFAEARLASGERKQVLTHLAVCRECREVVALTAGDLPLKPVEKETRNRWWNLRWATALAAACVVGLVIWHSTSLPPVAPKPVTPVQPTEPAAKPETPKPGEPAALTTARPNVQRRLDMRPAAQSPSTPRAAAATTDLSDPPPPTVDERAKSGQDTLITVPLLEALKAAPHPTLPAQTMAFQKVRPIPMKAFAAMARRQSLWSIAPSSGLLQKSDDGGRTWTVIPVSGRANFLALSVSGQDIWAGGEDGALFHSTDDGFAWKEVPVTDGGEQLKESIIGIEAQGSQVKVRTKAGNWISADGGVSWRKMGE